MKAFLLFILLAVDCGAQGFVLNPFRFGGGGGPGGGYLLQEDFEAVGYDQTSPNTWGETIGTGGSVNEDNASSPLHGTQDLLIAAGTAGQVSYARYDVGSDQNEAWIHIMFSIDALPTAGDMLLLMLRDSADNTRCVVYLRPASNGQTVKIDANFTGQASTAATYAAGTPYHLWIHFKNDGTGSLGFGTTTTEPTSGSNFAAYTGGDTAALRKIDLRVEDQRTVHFDYVLWKSSVIGNVP